ncbi:MAG: AAA family ATPase [Acidiferrobacterales bacterium]
MRAIMLLNTKGGSGKTTLATNLAVYYAAQDKSVVLADFDRQGSSLAWLSARPENRPRIQGVAAWQETLRVPEDTDYVIMDVPSGHHGERLVALVRYAQTVIVPVLPSPLDIRAAADFIEEIRRVGEVTKREIRDISFFRRLFGESAVVSDTRIAVVANRVRENTLAYDALYDFLDRLKVPFLTTLRDTQNYIQAAERGLGLFELAPSQVAYDVELWEPLVKWLNSRRSLPR